MIETAVGVSVEAFGLSDRGKVRDANEDHFVIAQVNKSVEVRQTSLPPDDVGRSFETAAAHLFAVADGVGVSGSGVAVGLGVGVRVGRGVGVRVGKC